MSDFLGMRPFLALMLPKKIMLTILYSIIDPFTTFYPALIYLNVSEKQNPAL